MDVKKILAETKHRAARLAIKIATIATVTTGTGVTLTSCNNNNKDKSADKIENVDGKTGVVFRTSRGGYHNDRRDILFEDGTSIFTGDENAVFLDVGDTVTYKKGSMDTKIKAVRYKSGNDKNVNFGKIGKLEKNR